MDTFYSVAESLNLIGQKACRRKILKIPFIVRGVDCSRNAAVKTGWSEAHKGAELRVLLSSQTTYLWYNA